MQLNEFCENMIQIEENAKVFYENLAGICDERIKEAVIMFARQEEKHKEIMEKLFKNLVDVKLDLNEEIKQIINEQMNFINKNKYINFEKEKDFFNFAFEIEKKSIDAYSRIIGVFETDTEEYKLFYSLIEEEKKHMIFILKIIHELK